MSERDATAEQQDRVLRELAELGLEFARELKGHIRLVKSVDEAERLTLAFHRATRSARLAIALQAKLARDRHELARLDRNETAKQVATRKTQIRSVLFAEIYTPEAEQEAADATARRLDEQLDREALLETLLAGPLDAAITRIRKDLGMAPVAQTDDAGPEPLTAVEAVVCDHEPHEPHERALIPAAAADSS